MDRLNLPRFELGDTITKEQFDFFTLHGAIVFRNFLTPAEVATAIAEINTVERKWLSEGVEKVNGVPLKFGKDLEGRKMIQRLCFLSMHSTFLHDMLQRPQVNALLDLLHPYQGRIAENEKDGLVLNHYLRHPDSSFSQMGWHTDSPRDLFLGQKIMPMLNVGIHLDNCPFENGGLRILPGTHKQGIFKLLFAKKYFIDNNPDPKEIGFDISAGDLTVHDGRLWHRAQQSPHFGEASRRRVMYVPVITGKYMPKHERSKTP
ncbi:MAG: phytanoyl-CoA dioxygenase family protein, partial [Bacteroidetes bacterium]|nr:phytanoyl-CoA dioxygenase family protein [Bacteroidota bacterium]